LSTYNIYQLKHILKTLFSNIHNFKLKLKFAERPLQLEVEVLKFFVSQLDLWYFVRQTICAHVELLKLHIT